MSLGHEARGFWEVVSQGYQHWLRQVFRLAGLQVSDTQGFQCSTGERLAVHDLLY